MSEPAPRAEDTEGARGEHRLAPLIRTVPGFPREGILFRDITTLLADGSGLADAVEAMAAKCDPGIAAVAGIEARGFVFAPTLALRLGVGFIPVRKAGKLPVATLREEYALEYGHATLELDAAVVPAAPVLLVDDLLATGGTALAAARLLRRAGASCDTALFLIDLPDLGGAARLAQEGITARAVMGFAGH